MSRTTPRSSVAAPRPTDTELRILNVLWDLGTGTVREVHAALSTDKLVGYTTALKMLQVMTEKGLVERELEAWPHRFRALHGRQATQGRLLKDLVRRAFGGSVDALVLHALSETQLSEQDRSEIERMLGSVGDSP